MSRSFYQLPAADTTWDLLKQTHMLAPKPSLFKFKMDESCVGEEVKIITPLDLKATPCPVTKQNIDSFTNSEREKAGRAEMAESLEDLEAKVRF
jgi:hypothetical protein